MKAARFEGPLRRKVVAILHVLAVAASLATGSPEDLPRQPAALVNGEPIHVCASLPPALRKEALDAAIEAALFRQFLQKYAPPVADKEIEAVLAEMRQNPWGCCGPIPKIEGSSHGK
jgi:hypothetical protein